MVKDDSGAPLGTLAVDGRAVALKIMRKNHPEFGQWLEEHAEAALRRLYDHWRNESGSGS